MKSKILLITLLGLLAAFVSIKEEYFSVPIKEISQKTSQPNQPLKVYFLSVLPEGSKRQVTINPPATKLIVTFQSGDSAIRCGDRLIKIA